MTRKPLVLVFAVAAALAGCTPDAEPAAPAPTTSPAAWTEPADYGFVLDRRCGDGPSLGRYRVLVRDAAVSSAERIDGRAAAGEEIQVPTLGEMLELARTAVEDGADATTTFDPADGHPVEVTINRAGEATGEADCFRVSDYAGSR